MVNQFYFRCFVDQLFHTRWFAFGELPDLFQTFEILGQAQCEKFDQIMCFLCFLLI